MILDLGAKEDKKALRFLKDILHRPRVSIKFVCALEFTAGWSGTRKKKAPPTSVLHRVSIIICKVSPVSLFPRYKLRITSRDKNLTKQQSQIHNLQQVAAFIAYTFVVTFNRNTNSVKIK